MARRNASLKIRSPTEGRVATGSFFSTILLTNVIATYANIHVDRVLDVGCGSSPYRSLWAPSFYLGIDHSDNDTSNAIIGNASELPVAASSFDGIICTEVIEHVSDERKLVDELGRVAKPGAHLLLSSPFVHGLHEEPRDFRRLTSVGLVTLLEARGWRVQSIASVGGPIVVWLDSCVRWCDQSGRRISRRVARSRTGLPVRAFSGVSRAVQTWVATLALHNPRSHLGPIDPGRPVPRLTLGYVVLAQREDTHASPGGAV